jgi:hypothetical protein
MELVRLYDVHPEMAEALEKTDVVEYTSILVDKTRTTNMYFGNDAIFPRSQHSENRPASPLIDLMYVIPEIPQTVMDLLKAFPGEVVVAGGFVTGCLMKDVEVGNDIDVFVVGSEERAKMIMEYILVEALPDTPTYRTGNAVTFFVKDGVHGDIPVQIILKIHTEIACIIEGFDIEPSKAAIYCDPSGSLKGIVSEGWIECAKTYSFPILAKTWSSTSTYRIIKYAAKGFQPYLCGLQKRFRERDYMFPEDPTQVRSELVEALQLCLGIEELLLAERYFKHENIYGWEATLTTCSIGCLTGLFRGIRRSDYASTGWGLSAFNRLTRTVARFIQSVTGSTNQNRGRRMFAPLTSENSGEVLFWKQAVGRRVHNCFYKADANLEGIVEM